MNGILIINKEPGYTSRDIVNIVSKKLNTRKVGHTGTLDPLASGVLVLCIGKHLKLVDYLTSTSKEYIAEFKLGILTDTLDITGTIEKEKNISIDKETLLKVIKSYQKKYLQEVPKYSAVRVNGKRLYDYARNNETIELPKREVEIKEIELLEYKDNIVKIKCQVSKGTYIRSLIRDIGKSLGTYATMTSLCRTKQGNFKIEDSIPLNDIDESKLLNPVDYIDMEKTVVDSNLEFKIKNGQKLPKFFSSSISLILDKDKNILAIYEDYKDNIVKPVKVF